MVGHEKRHAVDIYKKGSVEMSLHGCLTWWILYKIVEPVYSLTLSRTQSIDYANGIPHLTALKVSFPVHFYWFGIGFVPFISHLWSLLIIVIVG